MKIKIFAVIALLIVMILITIFIPFLGILLFLTGIVWLISLKVFKMIKNKIKEENTIMKVEMILGFALIGASALVMLSTFPMVEILGIATLSAGVIWLIWGLSH